MGEGDQWSNGNTHYGRRMSKEIYFCHNMEGTSCEYAMISEGKTSNHGLPKLQSYNSYTFSAPPKSQKLVRTRTSGLYMFSPRSGALEII